MTGAGIAPRPGNAEKPVRGLISDRHGSSILAFLTGDGDGPPGMLQNQLKISYSPHFCKDFRRFPGKINGREQGSLPFLAFFSAQPAAFAVSRSSVMISFSREKSTTAPLPCQEASHFWKSA